MFQHTLQDLTSSTRAKAMSRTMRVAECISSDAMDPSSAVDHCVDIVDMSSDQPG